jgi:hypothetical protein
MASLISVFWFPLPRIRDMTHDRFAFEKQSLELEGFLLG